MKARIGFCRPRNMVVDTAHHNCVAATALETTVLLTSLDDGELFQLRVSSRRLNLTPTVGVNLGREDVTGWPDETSDLQGVLPCSRSYVCHAAALMDLEHGCEPRGLASDAGGTDARNEQPAARRHSCAGDYGHDSPC